jgi:hypothetical protein
MTGQMYVEELQPPTEAKQKYPLVFMAGGSQTGTVWIASSSYCGVDNE